MIAGLTPRQRELSNLLCAGHTVRTASVAMGIAYSSARSHVRDACRYYGVHGLAELVAAHGNGAPYSGPYAPPRPDGLTPAEFALFELAATGLTWTEICALNHRTYNTLRRQTQQAYRKLGVRGKLAALAKLGLMRTPAAPSDRQVAGLVRLRELAAAIGPLPCSMLAVGSEMSDDEHAVEVSP